jgi:signal transduction histidine kinase
MRKIKRMDQSHPDKLINNNKGKDCEVDTLLLQISNQQRDIDSLQAQITQLQKVISENSTERDVWRNGMDKLLLISETVSDTLFSEPIFQTIVEAMLELTGFKIMTISFFDQHKKIFNIVASRGLDEESVKIMKNTPISSDDYVDIAARTQKPVYTSKYAMESNLGSGWPALVGINSFIVIPCMADGLAQGMLGLFSPDIEIWDNEKIEWLIAVGRRMANILYRVRLVKQLRAAAVLEERVRLGREFHDHLAQVLSYLNIKSQMAQTLLTSGKINEVSEILEDIEEVTTKTYDDVHDSILDLRFFTSADKNLVLSLQDYIQDYQRRYKIHVELNDDNWTYPHLPPEKEIQILRIVQEAMTNVRKHAEAKQVQLILLVDKNKAKVIVKDDGRGFNPGLINHDTHQNLGLQSMKERAESIGAKFEIISRIGAGTEVVLEATILQAESQD